MSEQNNSNKNSHNSTSRLILEKLTSLEDNLNDYKKTTDLKLTSIVHTLSSLNTKVDNVLSDMSTIKNDMSTIKNDMSTIKNNVSILKNDVIDLLL